MDVFISGFFQYVLSLEPIQAPHVRARKKAPGFSVQCAETPGAICQKLVIVSDSLAFPSLHRAG